MIDDGQFNSIETPKDIVVYRGGWGFLLPKGHTVRVNRANDRAELNTRDGGGGFYELERIDDTDPDELRLFVAPGGLSSTPIPAGRNDEGYPFPTMKVEIDRLRARWDGAVESKLSDLDDPKARERQEFEASAAGDTFAIRTERMRGTIRAQERATQAKEPAPGSDA
jgi:hypothetical protein